MLVAVPSDRNSGSNHWRESSTDGTESGDDAPSLDRCRCSLASPSDWGQLVRTKDSAPGSPHRNPLESSPWLSDPLACCISLSSASPGSLLLTSLRAQIRPLLLV